VTEKKKIYRSKKKEWRARREKPKPESKNLGKQQDYRALESFLQ
jgi:hypothetical protein